MKKQLLAIAVLAGMLCGPALADLSREQRLSRVSQALDAWQKSGKVWQGRAETDNGLATVYFQYPGKLYVDFDGGNDYRVTDNKVRYTNGNEDGFEDWGLWILASGSVGKDVDVLMVDEEPNRFYSNNPPVVVCDLVTHRDRGDNARIRIFVTSEGEPKLLGWTSGSNSTWLRDFHPITPAKDLFSTPKL